MSIIPERRLVAALLLGAVPGLSALHAQDAARHPTNPHVFLERSYFAPASPLGKGLLFEGEAAGHYFFYNGFNWDWTRSGGLRIAVPVSMIFTVRMSDDFSSPVRTPSYKIRPIWVQALYLRPEGTDPLAFDIKGVSAGITHYSNGQSGCTFRGFVPDTEGADCVVADDDLARQRIANVRDGSFSTTYLAVRGDWRWGRQRQAAGPMAHQHTVEAEFQVHPVGFRPGGIDTLQAREYGLHQVNLGYEYEQRTDRLRGGVWRLALRGTYRTPFRGGEAWKSGDLEASFVSDPLRHVGLFVRLHAGGDYYNIRFQEDQPFVALGVMWDPNRIDYHNRAGRPVRRPPAGGRVPAAELAKAP